MIRKQLEKRRVDKKRLLLIKRSLFIFQHMLIGAENGSAESPGILLHLREIMLHRLRNRRRAGRHQMMITRQPELRDDQVGIRRVRFMPVIIILVADIQKDVQTTDSTHRQSGNNDKAISLVLQEKADR